MATGNFQKEGLNRMAKNHVHLSMQTGKAGLQ